MVIFSILKPHTTVPPSDVEKKNLKMVRDYEFGEKHTEKVSFLTEIDFSILEIIKRRLSRLMLVVLITIS